VLGVERAVALRLREQRLDADQGLGELTLGAQERHDAPRGALATRRILVRGPQCCEGRVGPAGARGELAVEQPERCGARLALQRGLESGEDVVVDHRGGNHLTQRRNRPMATQV
jgi:hypothetical protein